MKQFRATVHGIGTITVRTTVYRQLFTHPERQHPCSLLQYFPHMYMLLRHEFRATKPSTDGQAPPENSFALGREAPPPPPRPLTPFSSPKNVPSSRLLLFAIGAPMTTTVSRNESPAKVFIQKTNLCLPIRCPPFFPCYKVTIDTTTAHLCVCGLPAKVSLLENSPPTKAGNRPTPRSDTVSTRYSCTASAMSTSLVILLHFTHDPVALSRRTQAARRLPQLFLLAAAAASAPRVALAARETDVGKKETDVGNTSGFAQSGAAFVVVDRPCFPHPG